MVVSALANDPSFAAVLFTALVPGPEAAFTMDEAKQLRPLDAPSTFMVPLKKDNNGLLFAIVNEDLVSTNLALPVGQSSAVKLDLLVYGDKRHSLGKVSVLRDKQKSRDAKQTEIVQTGDGLFWKVSKRHSFWHPLPEIRHRNPEIPKHNATLLSTLVTFLAAVAPFMTFFTLLRHAGVVNNMSRENLSGPACAFLSLVFLSAGLLVAYWTVLDLFMFLGIVIWLIPPAVLVVHHAFSKFREHGRLCIAAPILE